MRVCVWGGVRVCVCRCGLSWFRSHSGVCFRSVPQEKEQKQSLRLEEMRVKDVEASRFSIGKKHIFALFYNTGK